MEHQFSLWDAEWTALINWWLQLDKVPLGPIGTNQRLVVLLKDTTDLVEVGFELTTLGQQTTI